MKDSQTIPVFLCSDENYFRHLCVVIDSIVSNTASKIHFIVLTSSKSDAEKAKVAKVCAGNKLTFVSVGEYDGLFASFPKKHGHISAATCFRYLIPRLDFPYDKGIYLDCDIVVRGDIRELFDADLGGAHIAGVYDYQKDAYVKGLGVENYFNAGVLLLDIGKMRAENSSEKLIQMHCELKERIKYLDQDVLNIAFKSSSAILPPKFGAISPLFRKELPPVLGQTARDMREAIYNPVIVHFTGPDKPWVIPRGFTAHPWTPLYFRHLRRTPYAASEAAIMGGFRPAARLWWYFKRHLTFFARRHFWKMRLLYLKNRKLY